MKAEGIGVGVGMAGVGGGLQARIDATSSEQFMNIINLNLVPAWNTAKAFSGPLAESEGGSFIAFSSIFGHSGVPDLGASGPAKAGGPAL